MPIDPKNLLSRSPQYSQADTTHGDVRGIVVDVADPLMQGRARVYTFANQGPYQDLDIESLPWSEPKFTQAGAFQVPELFQRVWVSYEHGDKYAPTYGGAWSAIPVGRGTLPFDSTTGTEIRSEAWSSHDLYPETNLVASTGSGIAFWLQDKSLNQQNALESINLMDTGGKSIKIWSMHLGQKPYPAVQSVPMAKDSSGNMIATLDGQTIAASTPIRDGVTPITQDVPGAIDFETMNAKRSIMTDDDGGSLDSMVQFDSDGDIGISQMFLDGELASFNAPTMQFQATNMFFNARNTFSPAMLRRRWD